MTEIQLRRIVERNAMEGSEQQSDGDERMMKDGNNISKFSKEAMTLGGDVYTCTDKESDILQNLCPLRSLCGRRQCVPHQKRSAQDNDQGQGHAVLLRAPTRVSRWKQEVSLCQSDGPDRENSISPSHSRFHAEHTSRRELCPAAVHLEEISHCTKVCTGTDEG